MKVLIIEDDKILSDTIKQCIEKEYETEQAYDGEVYASRYSKRTKKIQI